MEDSLAEAFPKAQKRVRKLIKQYKEIGPPGRFAIMMMERSLDDAEKAAASGNVIDMIRAYNDLRGYKS